MGKNIKGKECGKGIFQRKDGWYIARFVDKYGKRHEKYFKTIPEARNWQADSQYQDRHGSIVVPVNMTVDTWFDYWIQNIVGDLAPNTLRNYRERYKFNIQPVIGGMQLTDVKPTRQASNGFVCTPCATLMRQEQLKAECNPRFCRSF